MSNIDNRDYIDDLEFIRGIADRDDIKVPESLSEETILAMLPDRDSKPSIEVAELIYDQAPASESVTAHAQTSAEPDASTTSAETRTPVNRKTPLRKWFAVAACLVLAVFGGTRLVSIMNAPPDTVTADGSLYTFRNESEIEKLIRSMDKKFAVDYGYDDAVTSDGAVEDSAPVAEEKAMDSGTSVSAANGEARSLSTSGTEFSETYLQVEEVDEADIVKTDGKYIYYVTDKQEVIILSADNGKTEKLSTIGSGEVDNYIQDIYLKGDTLVTIGYFYDDEEEYTGAVTYDISDRRNPKMIADFRQTGNIVSSRMVGNNLYLVTSDYVFSGGRILPKCTIDGKYSEMDATCISCVPNPNQTSYIILSAIDITSGKKTRSRSAAVFGASNEVYCNDHNLYAAVSEWDDKDGKTYTRIVRAALDGLNIRFNGTARVPGYIDDQFSMDEYDGYFRIATTGQRAGMDVNNLYVLDSKLKETGSVTGFARNESIRAVRYFGEKAYVITYEAIDPLFVIDLSDPAAPKIDGEVKIDGFSTLLVPAGEGKLLGIGHATGDNGYGGEFDSGLKLALFDISDPSEPKVLDSKEFEAMESPATDTHKALTVNSKEGWYAMPYGIYNVIEETETDSDQPDEPEIKLLDGGTSENEYEAGVLMFSAGDKLNVLDQHELAGEYLTRSIYIGDYIYALGYDGKVYSFKYNK